MSIRLTRKKIIYNCSSCGGELDSNRADIGQRDVCPLCNHTFTVPGQKLLEIEKAREEEKERRMQESEANSQKLALQKKNKEIAEQAGAEEENRRKFETDLDHGQLLICKQCQGTMTQQKLQSGACAGGCLSMIIFVVGLIILVTTFWTIIGAILGLMIMVWSLFIGGKSKQVWRCNKCGIILDRGM